MRTRFVVTICFDMNKITNNFILYQFVLKCTFLTCYTIAIFVTVPTMLLCLLPDIVTTVGINFPTGTIVAFL